MNIQNDVLDYLGSEFTEEMLHQEFDGKSSAEILAVINEWFPSEENNEKFADLIYEYVD